MLKLTWKQAYEGMSALRIDERADDEAESAAFGYSPI